MQSFPFEQYPDHYVQWLFDGVEASGAGVPWPLQRANAAFFTARLQIWPRLELLTRSPVLAAVRAPNLVSSSGRD